MKHYLLLHGSFHGAWCWSRLVPRLAESGHVASAPELSWSAGSLKADWEPAAEFGHIAPAIDAHSGMPCTLIVHSFSGMLAPEVACHFDQIDEVIYLDAFVPETGATAFELLGDFGGMLEAQASSRSDDCIPNPPIDALGQFAPEEAHRLSAKLLPMPAATHRAPCRIGGQDVPDRIESRFILCERFDGFRDHAARANALGYRVDTIDCGHDAMLERPDQLAELILPTIH